MKIKALFITFLLLGFFGLTQAQDQPLNFEGSSHDFGEIMKGDKAEHVFRFTNTSDAPVKLTSVKASCGCTTPAWTKEPVNPGEEGEIKVAYNTNRIGRFRKSVTVQYEGASRPMVLYINGEVKSTADSDASVYTFNNGGSLAFDKLAQNIGTLNSDQEKELLFKIKNIGPDKVQFDRDLGQELEFEVKMDMDGLAPGESTTIRVKVLGDRFISPGNFARQVIIRGKRVNSGIPEVQNLTISGNLNKVLSAEEKAMQPHIDFERTEYNGGKVIEGEKVKIAYVFTNTGKSDLKIESVKASCGCTASAPKDDVIKPGESSEILATFDSRGRTGMQSKSITVRTNDPDNSTVILRLKVEVVKDPFHMGGMGPATGSTRGF